jgi:hypothetical protein
MVYVKNFRKTVMGASVDEALFCVHSTASSPNANAKEASANGDRGY